MVLLEFLQGVAKWAMAQTLPLSFLVFLVALLASSSLARDNYTYPINDPIQSTFTFSLIKGRFQGWQKSLTVLRPGRSRPELYRGPNGYPINCFFHRGQQKRTLVYLLVGIGGDVRGNGALFIANRLYQKGFHVVILPSTFNDYFIHTASRHLFVGQARLDADSQYEVLLEVDRQVQEMGVSIGKKHLFGYSFGAAVGAFLAEKDDERKGLGIDRYVLLNPPIDLLSGLKTVDDFASTRVKRLLPKAFEVVTKIVDFRSRGQIEQDAEEFFDNFRVPERDLRFFIGQSLRSSLTNVIFYTQSKVDLGILEGRTPLQRKWNARNYSFYDYVREFVAVYYQNTAEGRREWRRYYQTPHYSLEQLQYMNSLYSLEKLFKTNERIYLIHNQDDFLLSAEDVHFLQKSLGERFSIYPRGGHLGNVWYHQNFNEYLSLLSGESSLQ